MGFGKTSRQYIGFQILLPPPRCHVVDAVQLPAEVLVENDDADEPSWIVWKIENVLTEDAFGVLQAVPNSEE